MARGDVSSAAAAGVSASVQAVQATGTRRNSARNILVMGPEVLML
jgi:hypothetical protein